MALHRPLSLNGRRRAAPGRVRLLAALMVLALLQAQAFLRLHAIEHSPLHAVQTQAPVLQALPGATGAGAGDTSASQVDVYGHRAGSLACQWLDELLLGQALGCDPTLAIHALPRAEPQAAPRLPELPAERLAAYNPRGPPRA